MSWLSVGFWSWGSSRCCHSPSSQCGVHFLHKMRLWWLFFFSLCFGSWGWFIKVIRLSTWHKEGWTLTLFMHQYLARVCHQIKTISILSLQTEETFIRMTTKLLFMVQNPHQSGVVAEKQLQESQSLQEKFWAITSLVLLQETCILKRTAYQQKVRWLQSSKGKRRVGQVFSNEKRTRQSFWRCAVPISPQISLPILHAHHVFFLICVYTEWQQILSN